MKGVVEVKVPFVDLKAQHAATKKDVEAAITNVIGDTAFIGGKYVEKFEKDYASFCGTQHVVGVSSGTSALQLALLAMGVGPGDEVVTAANTFIATAEAISHTGATPVFVDMNPQTYNIDVAGIERAITDRTKVLIPVHLYGQPADMDPILEIARKHNLLVLEDAAQAQGARYKGKRCGSFGHAAAFSFYPAKNLGAYGDAGAVATNDAGYVETIQLYMNHGRKGAREHAVIGFNERLDGLQAAVLDAKLDTLDEWNQMRRAAAGRYDELLGGLNVVTPRAMADVEHIYHLYVVRVKDRDEVRKALGDRGVASGIHYVMPVHLLEAYKGLGLGRGSFPAAEEAAEEIVSLPMFPHITAEQQQYVAQCLEEIVGKRG
jgi:dTDP-4-amino-4,6-dideoxygalactose transaminase